jgi:hypothetical protein
VIVIVCHLDLQQYANEQNQSWYNDNQIRNIHFSQSNKCRSNNQLYRLSDIQEHGTRHDLPSKEIVLSNVTKCILISALPKQEMRCSSDLLEITYVIRPFDILPIIFVWFLLFP